MTTEAIVNVTFIYVCRVKIKDNLNKMREKKSILQFPARRGIFASSWETSASREILQKQGYGFLAEAMSFSNLRVLGGDNFGETVSIVLWTDTWKPDSFYDKIAANKKQGLHTLCLLGRSFMHLSIKGEICFS